MTRRLILFDIDGTLLRSRGAGRRAILAAMADLLGDDDCIAGVRFDGKTDPQIVMELLAASGVDGPDEPGRIAEVLERYVGCLERELALSTQRTSLMPGVADLLDHTERADRAVLGLLTGNVAPGARLKLRSAALDPARFRVGAYGSDAADRRLLPAIASERARALFGRRPEGEEVVIVGDTPADVLCGAAIGARAIGVATGSYSVAELEAAGAQTVFVDLSDRDQVWQAIWS